MSIEDIQCRRFSKQLKSTIISLFRSSSSVKLFSTTNLSVKKPNLSTPPLLLSNSFFHTGVTHGGGPRNFCSISSSLLLTECEVASSSSSEVNVTTQNIQRKNLCTLWTSIPVRAYCLSHKIDLMGLIYENQANLIPHTPGIGNYIIIKRHASGMLPEMAKDGGDSSQLYMIKFPFLDCKVDRRISEYANVNIGLEESGILRHGKKLVELARKTRADAEVVHCFGLSERSDVTWNEGSKYSHMFDYLRDEFKLTQRFANLDRKFKMGELIIWFTMVEMGILWVTAGVAAYLIGFTLLLCLPVVTLRIRALEAYLMSI
ncbi:hypothetical protein MKX03_004395 [Papaver bracteatum]|nr:hypothetical protein MKX03_004395 [Papaver bracteatum]